MYNFPATFAGEDQNVNAGQGGSTFGIWNASSHQQIQFLQRFDQFELSVRVPVWMTERYRSYGLIGPRLGWIWERFKWRTVDADVTGLSVADDVAIYSNIVSNRLYGVHIGGGQEWFMGDSPAGAFSISLDGETGLFLNMVKVRSKYELGDYSVVASRARNLSTLAPMASAKINLWWYPVEAIQLTLGYDVLMYFNTVAAREPIDFNFGNTAPKWERGIVRLYHGISFGIGITF